MTLFSENDAPQNSRLSWDPTGRLTDVQDMVDSRINRSSFYQDVFLPAWKSMGEAAATLFLEWFSGGLNFIGQLANTYNAIQRDSELRHYQGSRKRYSTPANPTPMEAPLGLRKITNKSGNSGGFNVENNASANSSGLKPLMKTNPWLEATKKQKCVLEVKPAPEPKTARSPKAGKKTLADEPIRGLDDIYTSPVTGFFAEDKDFSPAKPVASQWKKTVGPGMNSQTIAALIDAELEQLPPNGKRHKAAPDGPIHVSPPHAPTDQQIEAVQNREKTGQEPLESEFIPGLSSQTDALPAYRFIEETKPELRPGLPAKPVASPGASMLLAKARALNLSIKRQMPVYQEMKVEMSGTELMIRNNQILHNSISNLADAYFKKAAAEQRANNA